MNKFLDRLRAEWRTAAAVVAVVVIIAVVRCSASDPEDAQLAFSTISNQGAPAQTSFAGIVDPTTVGGPAGASVMTACLSSCSAPLAQQNRAALKATFDYASSNRMAVHIPANEYPVACAAGQSYGVNVTGSNLFVLARGVTLRFTGDQGSADCAMFRITGSNVKIEGATFSGRDVTNATTGTVLVKIGDGGSTTVDNVALIDDQFTAGIGGDYVRIDGGSSSTTVTRVTLERDVFDISARAGVDVRPGSGRISIIYNFFRANANRAIWFEDSGAGPIGSSTILGNFIETNIANPAVTLAGHGGSTSTLDMSTFTANRVIALASGTTGGGTIEGTNLSNMVISANTITTNRSTSAPTVALFGAVDSVKIVDNYLDRHGTASSAAVISVIDDSTFGPTNVTIQGNRIRQYSGIAPGIDISGAHRTTVTENNITYHHATADSGATGFSGVYCSGTAVAACGGTISRNIIRRDDQEIYASLDLAGVTLGDTTVVEFFRVGREGNAATLRFVGDSGTTPGSMTGTSYAKVLHYRPAFTTTANAETLLNDSIRVKTASGAPSYVLQAGDAFGPTALAGGVQAGRMRAGVMLLKGAGTTIDTTIIRDNVIDGSASIIYVDATGAAQWPETYPLISGNQPISIGSDFDGGIATWLTETTKTAETVAAGACGVSKDTTFITTSGTANYNQPDGLKDGKIHCYKVKTATSSPVGTWSPTTAGHFADGTTHTITWTTATDVSWCVAWDATSTTYRLVSKSAGATLN